MFRLALNWTSLIYTGINHVFLAMSSFVVLCSSWAVHYSFFVDFFNSIFFLFNLCVFCHSFFNIRLIYVGSRLKRERFVSVRPKSETMRRSRTSASPPWPHFLLRSLHMPASAHWNTADTTGSTRLQTHHTRTNRTPATDTPLQQTGIYCNNYHFEIS